MRPEVVYLTNKASDAETAEFLWNCDADFVPPLSTRVEIKDYSKKIVSKATRFEAWSGGKIVGLVAAFCNDQEMNIAYITNVSLLRKWTGKGIAYRLMGQCIEHAKALGMQQIRLEVATGNTAAIKLYEKSGFVAVGENLPFVIMNLNL
jgi:ribosomal protein S18 acetylase RimI-like enzyme